MDRAPKHCLQWTGWCHRLVSPYQMVCDWRREWRVLLPLKLLSCNIRHLPFHSCTNCWFCNVERMCIINSACGTHSWYQFNRKWALICYITTLVNQALTTLLTIQTQPLLCLPVLWKGPRAEHSIRLVTIAHLSPAIDSPMETRAISPTACHALCSRTLAQQVWE